MGEAWLWNGSKQTKHRMVFCGRRAGGRTLLDFLRIWTDIEKIPISKYNMIVVLIQYHIVNYVDIIVDEIDEYIERLG